MGTPVPTGVGTPAHTAQGNRSRWGRGGQWSSGVENSLAGVRVDRLESHVPFIPSQSSYTGNYNKRWLPHYCLEQCPGHRSPEIRPSREVRSGLEWVRAGCSNNIFQPQGRLFLHSLKIGTGTKAIALKE